MFAGEWQTLTMPTGIVGEWQTTDIGDLGGEFPYLLIMLPTLTSTNIRCSIDDGTGTYRHVHSEKAESGGCMAWTVMSTTGDLAVVCTIGAARFVRLCANVAQEQTRTFRVRGFE